MSKRTLIAWIGFGLALVIFICWVVVFMAFGDKPDREPEKGSYFQTCNLSTYRANAEPLMQEFGEIVKQLEIRDATSRAEIKSDLEILLSKINQVDCRNDFPLKHETLEYSVRHMIDAIEYADKGDFVEANYSINKSLLNVETFQDWSVDVD